MDNDDLETMDIGGILDFIDEYLISKNPELKQGEVIHDASLVPWL